MNYTLVCDGAYSFLKNQMGVGIIFLREDTPILKFSKMFSGGTNNQAEIIAIIIGLKFVKKPINSLIVLSDSMHCIGHINSGWKRNRNIKLWEEFDKQLERVKQLCPNIEFKYVKGHSDNKWNNQADKLAVEASQKL